MISRDIPRGFISIVVIALFAFAFGSNPDDEMMQGSLIAAFATVVNFWLGSSKGSSDKTEQLAKRQEVEVVNDPSNPVPVDEGRWPVDDR